MYTLLILMSIGDCVKLIWSRTIILCLNICFLILTFPKNNISIPDGKLRENDVHDYCLDYEARISELGGIDIQILGIEEMVILDSMNWM